MTSVTNTAPRLIPGTPEEAGMSSRRIQHVRELAAGWVEDGMHPALVVLVARRGVIVLYEAYGKLTPDAGSPILQRDSIFPLASLTKPITATAVMALVEDGLLGLNRPVQSYIPEFVGDGKADVLVHHLLTHTSGLRVDMVYLLQLGFDPPAGTPEEMGLPPLEETQHPLVHSLVTPQYGVPLSMKPGEEMIYCDLNYALLGEIVRRVGEQSYASFATERILEPLGMNDTHFIVPNSMRSRAVKRPEDSVFAGLNEEWIMDVPMPWAGVFSTAHDMGIFGQMFLNGGVYGDTRILSSPTVAAMTRNQIPGVGSEYRGEHHDEAPWGYGWNIHAGVKWAKVPGALMSPETFQAGGAGGVHMWVDPTYELVGIYFSVVTEMLDDAHHRYAADLFGSAVTAAIDD